MLINDFTINLSGCLENHTLRIDGSQGIAMIYIDDENVAKLHKEELEYLTEILRVFAKGMV